jgi:hypothetical protein
MNHQTNPNRQSLKARLLAGSLFTLSACGTLALFGSVPVIARMLSTAVPSVPEASRPAAEQHLPNWKFSEQPPIRAGNRS